MAKTEIVKIRYFTQDKKDKINPDNIKLYDKYLKSNIIKNREVKETTYKTYENYFNQFLAYLSEEWENIGLYEQEFMENAVDILEGFISFCQDTLKNNKKVINTKLSAVSSFYLWSMKRKLIPYHPFDKRLDRMKGAREEKIINSYFLSEEEIMTISKGLEENKDNKFDLLDLVLWNVALDSANRIGALHSLKLSQLDLDDCCFTDVREKEGYRVSVSFSEDTKEIILAWLEHRKENMDNLEVDALFISKYYGEYRQMGKNTLQKRVQKIGTIIGIDDFHAHCIRKTSSEDMLRQGVDPSLVSKYLNHKDISTTLSFYSKPKSSVEIRDEIKNQLKMLNKKS